MSMADRYLRNFEVDTLRVGDLVDDGGHGAARCTSTSAAEAGWWLCDRADGHTGEHATVSHSGMVLATWADGDFDALLQPTKAD
ncbi:hypothetical protein ACWDTI_07260 [Gordonia sp. NPDC003424]